MITKPIPPPDELGVASCSAPLETTHCDVCDGPLTGTERTEYRDTGFRECRDCSISRHLTEQNDQAQAQNCQFCNGHGYVDYDEECMKCPTYKPMNQLIHGDCLLILPSIPSDSVDLVICDLPYSKTEIEWDKDISLDFLWTQFRRICKETSTVIMFGSQPFTKKTQKESPSL